MSDEFDWDDATGSGLLDRYEGVVKSSEFGIDEDYRDDTVRLMWDIEVIDLLGDPDAQAEIGDLLSEAFNAGNVSTFEAVDGGKKVARVDGKRVKFNQNSGVGQLVNLATGKAIKTTAGSVTMENADDLKKVLRERGGGDNSKIWEGLQFEFQRLEFSFKNDEDELITYGRTYPIRFVGESGN